MYGLPPDFDATVIMGKRLDLVCFSANTITLSFEGYILITIMGSFTYQKNLNVIANKQSVPVSCSALMSLTDKVVQHAEGSQDGTLTLHFDNGHVLTLLDDSQEYESYNIRVGSKEIIV